MNVLCKIDNKLIETALLLLRTSPKYSKLTCKADRAVAINMFLDDILYILSKKIARNWCIAFVNEKSEKFIKADSITYYLDKNMEPGWDLVEIPDIGKLRPFPTMVQLKFLSKEYLILREVDDGQELHGGSQ